VISKHQRRRNHRARSHTPPHPVKRLPNPLQPSSLLPLSTQSHNSRLY
jgi:hypothetical protein